MEKEYNFDILFEKLEEVKDGANIPKTSDMQMISDVISEIEYLKDFVSQNNERDVITYTRS